MHQFVAIDAHYKNFAMFLCLPEQIQMPDMKHIKNAGSIPYIVFLHSLESSSLCICSIRKVTRSLCDNGGVIGHILKYSAVSANVTVVSYVDPTDNYCTGANHAIIANNRCFPFA